MTHRRLFEVRARENRKLTEAVAGENYLFDAVRKVPSAGTRSLEVKPTTGRKGRTTTVHVSFSKVCIAPPGEKLGENANEPLEMWVVRVWEPNPPAGEEPLEWILLTNCAVENFVDHCERIESYEKRWIVEELHKGMKTGCVPRTPGLVASPAHASRSAIFSRSITLLATLCENLLK